MEAVMRRYWGIFVDGFFSGLGWSLAVWIVVAVYLATKQ
jgi:hypothetical protein